MKLNLPYPLRAILTGTAFGCIGSVLLSLTLEPEISESRMGQYGAFIGLIASATSVALVTVEGGNSNHKKSNFTPEPESTKIDFNPLLAKIVQNAAEKHLNALQPGSSEYFETLGLYGKLLSGENDPPHTNT